MRVRDNSKESQFVEKLQVQHPGVKVMTTAKYRRCLREGLSTDGYNLYLAGKMGYVSTRLSYNAVFQNESEDYDPNNVIKTGHPLPGIYKIVSIDGENDTSSRDCYEHGYHHSVQTLTCFYSKILDDDFITEETVEIFSYPLWQSVAARDTNYLYVGDVFEVDSFDLIDSPYTCYRLQWHLISREKKTGPFSCATEGESLPSINTSKTLISELRKVRNSIAESKNIEYYMVLNDKTLQILADKKPKTFAELLSIPGFGVYKTNAYGGKMLYVIKCFEKAKKRAKPISIKTNQHTDGGTLEDELRQYRTNKAREEAIPSYCVYSDSVLSAIVTRKPMSRSALLAVHGFGPAKYEKYGVDILRIVKKSSNTTEKVNTVQVTVDLYNDGLTPKEIAIERNLKVQTIYSHLFMADIVDPHEILSEYQYDQSYTFWANGDGAMISEVYGDEGYAAFYYIKSNHLEKW